MDRRTLIASGLAALFHYIGAEERALPRDPLGRGAELTGRFPGGG
jgi:hypothetical protein